MRVIPHFLCYLVGIAQAETPTLPAELEAILRHARGKRRLVEIGIFHGYTTRRIREVMAPDGVLYAVDPFLVGRLGFSAQRWIAQQEATTVRRGTTCWMRCTGAEAGREHQRTSEPPVEFIYVDGDNTYEGRSQDWAAWSGRLVPNGVILLHASQSSQSYNIDHAGSVKHTREVALKDPRFALEEAVENLVILRRKGHG